MAIRYIAVVVGQIDNHANTMLVSAARFLSNANPLNNLSREGAIGLSA